MLIESQNEYNQVCGQLNNNLVKLQEAKEFENTFLANEELDYKVFSPRNKEALHKDEISKIREEKAFYENENEKLIDRKNALGIKIGKLEKVLSEEREQGYATLKIQEADRQRIARDLHDTSLQNLAHLVHKIELSSMYIDTDPIHAKLELTVVNKKLKAVIDEIRNTIFNLRPMTFDDLGMKAALERLIAVINENKDYVVDLDIEDVSCENNLLLVTIYRVIQECLNNIVKHSKATRIFFHSKLIDGKYYIVIKDNGIGFHLDEIENEEDMHFGMTLMKERVELIGGEVSIQSDNGTEIKICIPI